MFLLTATDTVDRYAELWRMKDGIVAKEAEQIKNIK